MGQRILSRIHFYKNLVANLVYLYHIHLYWLSSGEVCQIKDCCDIECPRNLRLGAVERVENEYSCIYSSIHRRYSLILRSSIVRQNWSFWGPFFTLDREVVVEFYHFCFCVGWFFICSEIEEAESREVTYSNNGVLLSLNIIVIDSPHPCLK